MAVCSDGRWRVNERPVLDREEEDVWDPGEPLRYPIRDHFGRSGQKWSGRVWGSLASNSKIPSATTSVRVWGSLASNSKIPSATTSVGLDESGPAECVGHLRAIQRYHPRPLRSVWTKVVRPSVGVTCEQFKDTIRDHFGRSGRKWSGRVCGSLANNSKVPHPRPLRSVWTSCDPAECGSLAIRWHRVVPGPRTTSVRFGHVVVRPSVGVTREHGTDTIRDTPSVGARDDCGPARSGGSHGEEGAGWLTDGRDDVDADGR